MDKNVGLDTAVLSVVGKILVILFAYIGLVVWTERRQRAMESSVERRYGEGAVGNRGRRQGRVA